MQMHTYLHQKKLFASISGYRGEYAGINTGVYATKYPQANALLKEVSFVS